MSSFERRVQPRYEDISDDASSSQDEANEALKIKWDELQRSSTRSQPSHPIPKRKASPANPSPSKAMSDSEYDSDSSEAPQALSATKPTNFTSKGLSKRSSKHAPQVLTSRKPVSRARTVISGVTTQKARDPRFDPGLANSLSRTSSGVTRHRYDFLNNYITDELTTLKKASKDSRATLEDREQAKKAASAIENRRRQQEQKEREETVVRAHRKEQRERERQQKSKGDGDEAGGPGETDSKRFYLKKGEIKRRVLEDKFKSMTEKQAERAMERKRRRRAGKERKLMPVRRA